MDQGEGNNDGLSLFDAVVIMVVMAEQLGQHVEEMVADMEVAEEVRGEREDGVDGKE